ncbi:MAG TPA: SDR family oxidoreductase [Steroidobacteraceae bacterium]|nr:SDR family oxidoreductase [Steroidobacteraceae bacterium]
MSARHGGRVAVVTGGSGGIGQAIACRLAREGARVAIADVADASETMDLVRREGGTAFGARCDISDGTQVADFVREVSQRLASPLILVHSAAVQFTRPFADITFEEWRHTQAVNQDAMFHFLQAVLPGMKAARWGRIIVIASSTFYINTTAMSHYVTSKGALIGLVHGLAGEVGEFGITINAVAPGLTRTKKAVADVPDAYFQHVMTLQAIPRNGTAEDQAGVVSFVASDDAGFMTGQTLLADGGQGRT